MSALVSTRNDELADLETIGFVATALFDVSAEKINHLRHAFERNAAFYEDIAELYRSVKQSAYDRGELVTERSSKVASKVLVAFTSNTRFYGSVNSEVIDTFRREMSSRGREWDYLMIGHTGQTALETEKLPAQCSYYAFAADEPTHDDMKQFLMRVEPYAEVTIMYPAFENVFAHSVAIQDVTYTPRAQSDQTASEAFDYLFEPELPKILNFFETRVRYLLFTRAMLESELARTAARLFAMNQAQDRATAESARLRRLIRRDRANFNDLRLLESFAAISRWKR